MRILIALLLTASAAQAFECNFTTECYEAEACGETNFALTVDIEGKKLVTEFGDITLFAVKELPTLKTLFATGEGAEYLLSVTRKTARLTTHANEGPQVISYLGSCEGAF